MMKNNLPNRWVVKKLGEVCHKITDGSHNPPKGTEQSEYMMLSSKNVFDNKINYKNPRFLAKEDFDSENKRTDVQSGDVLLTIVGTIGRAAVVKEGMPQFTLQRSVAVLKPKHELIDSRFLMFLSICNLETMQDGSRGVAQKGIYLKTLRELSFPVPSLPEQKRIVALLDEAFEGIDKVIENTKKNLQNTRDLFQSYLQQIFTNKGDGWEERKLGDMSKINYGYTEKASSKNIGPKFLRITDIKDSGVDWMAVPYCKIDEKEHKKHKLKNHDIVFARTGATTGKSFLVRNPPDSVCASYLIRLRLTNENLIPEFVSLFFQTRGYWNSVNSGISGSAQGGFNASKLGQLIITIPPPLEQKRIVTELDKLSEQTKRLEAIYQQKLDDLAELKQSILQKAFTGELSTSYRLAA